MRVARRLHEDGIITGKFGRTVPIIVHELEIYDAIIEQTREANPPGATDEFEEWYNAMGEQAKPSRGIRDREEAVEAIRNSAFSATAESLATFLEPSARIFVFAKDGTERFGDVQLTFSYFGGLPTLPENVAWPTWNKSVYIQDLIAVMERVFERELTKAKGSTEDLRREHQEDREEARGNVGRRVSLAFLGQLSLREIQAVAPMPGWPKEGILAFFYDPAQIRGHRPTDRGHGRILFFPEDAPMRRLDYPESLGKKGRYPKRALTARCEWTLEKYVHSKKNDIPFWKKKEYPELLEKLNADGPDAIGPVHRCGGHAQELEPLLRMQCQLVTNGINWFGISSASKNPRAMELGKSDGDWELVMQFDCETNLDWKWRSEGRIYFMARRQDIEAGDFSNSWAILQHE